MERDPFELLVNMEKRLTKLEERAITKGHIHALNVFAKNSADDLTDKIRVANRVVQVEHLKLAVITEAAFIERVRGASRDGYLAFTVALIDMLEEPDAWWEARMSMIMRDWIVTIKNRIGRKKHDPLEGFASSLKAGVIQVEQ